MKKALLQHLNDAPILHSINFAPSIPKPLYFLQPRSFSMRNLSDTPSEFNPTATQMEADLPPSLNVLTFTNFTLDKPLLRRWFSSPSLESKRLWFFKTFLPLEREHIRTLYYQEMMTLQIHLEFFPWLEIKTFKKPRTMAKT